MYGLHVIYTCSACIYGTTSRHKYIYYIKTCKQTNQIIQFLLYNHTELANEDDIEQHNRSKCLSKFGMVLMMKRVASMMHMLSLRLCSLKESFKLIEDERRNHMKNVPI